MSIKKSVLNFLGLGAAESGAQASAAQPQSVEAFLEGLGAQMGFDVQFEKTTQEDGTIVYQVKGSEVDSFLGNTTEALDALGHLSMRIQRRIQGLANAPAAENENLQRIRFDAEGFRERRRQELIELAKKMHQKVIDTGKAAYINAMNPADRKVIHTAIAELGSEIVTESIGKGHYKRIRVKSLNFKGGFRGERQDRSGGRGGRRGGGRGFRSNANRDANATAFAGNFVNSDPVVNMDEVIDDNIGNRLAPGEESPFFKTETN